MKSLSCESGKTNSCSNTSKNAVQYIAIKNNSCFFVGSDHLTFASTQPPFLKWESGAKLSVIFRTTKSFRKIFFEYFSEPSSLHFRLAVLSEAGAKVRQIFESPKDFGTFFKIFQNPFQHPGEVFFSRSGCKDKDFFRQHPNIFRTFFRTFSWAGTHKPIRQQVSYEYFLISLQYHQRGQR